MCAVCKWKKTAVIRQLKAFNTRSDKRENEETVRCNSAVPTLYRRKSQPDERDLHRSKPAPNVLRYSDTENDNNNFLSAALNFERYR
jgi:hypothetical protein